jgi:hypothetical protein
MFSCLKTTVISFFMLYLLLAWGSSASAQSLTMGYVTGMPGEEVSIPITMEQASDVVSIRILVTLPSHVEFVKWVKEDTLVSGWSLVINDQGSYVIVTGASASALPSSGTLIQLVVKIKTDATSEVVSMSFRDGTRLNDGAIPLTLYVDHPANKPPTEVVNKGASVVQGASVTIQSTSLAYTDVEDNDDDLIFTVTSFPARGTLKNATGAMVASTNESFTQAELFGGTAIVYTHDGTDHFTDEFTFSVRDLDDGVVEAQTFALTINPLNRPPILSSPITDINKAEDSAPFMLDLANHFTDPDGDSLIYTVTYNDYPSLVSTSINGSILTFTLGLNNYGFANITVSANDSISGTITDSFVVNVSPVNDAPVITQGNSVSVTMDKNGSPTPWVAPTITATDVESNSSITWSVHTAPSHGTASVSGTNTRPSEINYVPATDYVGTDSFVIKASDGFDMDTITVYITINDVFAAPVITQAGPLLVEMDEDGVPTAWVTPIVTASDSNAGDILTWSLAAVPTNGTATVSGAGNTPTVLDYAPNLNFNGTDQFDVQVSDGTFNVTIEIQVLVNAVNDAPVIAQTEPLSVTMSEDSSPVAWAAPVLNATDVDSGDILTWSLAAAPLNGDATVEGVGISPTTLDYSPNADFFGTDEFIVQVSDSLMNTTRTISVIIEPVNDAPTHILPVEVSVLEDNSLVFSATEGTYLSAWDIDSTSLTTTVSVPTDQGVLTVVNENGTITGNNTNAVQISGMVFEVSKALGELIYTPPLNANGIPYTTMTITSMDEDSATTTNTLEITVDAVNDNPELVKPLEDIMVDEDSAPLLVDLSQNFTDVDLDTLLFEVTENDNPTLVSAIITDTTLELVFGPDQYGEANLSIQASDGSMASVSDTLIVSVTPVNDVPVIAEAPAVLVSMDENGTPTAWSAPIVSATDIDLTDTLTWSLLAPPANGTAEVSGEGTSPVVFDYAPVAGYSGLDSFVIQVSDGIATATLTVEVEIHDIATAPIILQVSPLEVEMDEDGFPRAWTAPILSATDEDIGDILQWSLASAPIAGGIADVTGIGETPTVFNYIPPQDYHGDDSFVVQVTDGMYTSEITIQVVIASIPDPVTATNMSQEIVFSMGDAVVELDDIVVTDPDEEPLTATLTLDNPESGVLTADSASGESFNTATGVWTIEGSVDALNAALEAVTFLPASSSVDEITITTRIVDIESETTLQGIIYLDAVGIVPGTVIVTDNTGQSYADLSGQTVLLEDLPAGKLVVRWNLTEILPEGVTNYHIHAIVDGAQEYIGQTQNANQEKLDISLKRFNHASDIHTYQFLVYPIYTTPENPYITEEPVSVDYGDVPVALPDVPYGNVIVTDNSNQKPYKDLSGEITDFADLPGGKLTVRWNLTELLGEDIIDYHVYAFVDGEDTYLGQTRGATKEEISLSLKPFSHTSGIHSYHFRVYLIGTTGAYSAVLAKDAVYVDYGQEPVIDIPDVPYKSVIVTDNTETKPYDDFSGDTLIYDDIPDGQLVLRWNLTDVLPDGIIDYHIYASADGETVFVDHTGSGDVEEYTIVLTSFKHLSDIHTYAFTVYPIWVDSAGNSYSTSDVVTVDYGNAPIMTPDIDYGSVIVTDTSGVTPYVDLSGQSIDHDSLADGTVVLRWNLTSILVGVQNYHVYALADGEEDGTYLGQTDDASIEEFEIILLQLGFTSGVHSFEFKVYPIGGMRKHFTPVDGLTVNLGEAPTDPVPLGSVIVTDNSGIEPFTNLGGSTVTAADLPDGQVVIRWNLKTVVDSRVDDYHVWVARFNKVTGAPRDYFYLTNTGDPDIQQVVYTLPVVEDGYEYIFEVHPRFNQGRGKLTGWIQSKTLTVTGTATQPLPQLFHVATPTPTPTPVMEYPTPTPTVTPVSEFK